MAELNYRKRSVLQLEQMHPTMTCFSTVALIIAKSDANVFLDKLSGEKRGVINFTLRGTKGYITNCKCWGTKDFIDEYNNMLLIGDVVDVVGAKVMAVMSESNLGLNVQRYHPRGTLSCALVVNEGRGYLAKHNPEDLPVIQPLLQLLHHSHKPLSTALKLADVCFLPPGGVASKSDPNIFVDLVVVVAALRPVRELKRKVARNGSTLLHCLEVVVMDATCPRGTIFTLWHRDWIRRAQQCWQPGKTLLHLIDVRLSHSPYYACIVLSHSSSTLIYENPQIQSTDCQGLSALAAVVPLHKYEIDMNDLPPAEQIQTKMTVGQIYSRAEGELKDVTIDHFTAVLYAMVTKFDIDGFSSCISKKCKSCQGLIPSNHQLCVNDHCRNQDSGYDQFFNINIQLSDHSGTLIEPRLSGVVAEQLLGLTVDAFEELSTVGKAAIKWRFLLKYFEIKLLVKKPSVFRRNVAVAVVDMELIQLQELIKKTSVF